RATKSTTGAEARLPAASTATLAPIRPALRLGLAALSASMVLTSDLKEGVEVCSTARSKSGACAVISESGVRCGGASISLLFSTSAAGWVSQVGYQNEAISRRAW